MKKKAVTVISLTIGALAVLCSKSQVSFAQGSSSNLVARWPLDEGQGTNVLDVSGHEQHGTLEGNPLPVWTSGVSSNALDFDGLQNEMRVAHDAGLTLTNALTLLAWLRASTNVTGEVLGKWSTNAVDGSYLLSLTNGLPQMELMLSSNYTVVTGTSGLIDTNWHQIAGTYNGAEMKVYVDAEVVGSVVASGTVNAVEEPLRVGLLEGRIDDVHVYNDALSTNGLAALYNADSDGDGVPDRVEADMGTDPNDPNSLPSGFSGMMGALTSDGSITCVEVPSTTSGSAWGIVCAGYTYTYTASGWCGRGPLTVYETDPDGKNHSGQVVGCAGGGGNPNAMKCPGLTCYSLVGKLADGSCIQLGTSGSFTPANTGTLTVYFNDDYYGDNHGSYTFCVTSTAEPEISSPPVVFVNSDDDNGNGTNDVNDAPTMTITDENDLIAVDLDAGGAPPCSTVRLSLTPASAPAGHVRVWTNQLRHSGGPLLDNASGISVSWTVSNMPAIVYLEGVGASTQSNDLTIVLTADCCSASATAKVTVVDIQSVTWTAKALSPLTNNADLVTGGIGKAIFPDRPLPTSAPDDYNEVDVAAVIKPAMPDITVYFTSIDVDDPSTNAAPVDDEALTQDNRGTPKTGNFATGGSSSTISWPTEPDGTATVTFITTMQPGDNFRVIASPLADFKNAYHARQNTSSGEVVMVVNANSVIATNYTTDMLTVWRRLWIERDTMGDLNDIDSVAAVGFVAKPSIEANTALLYPASVGSYVGYAEDDDEFEGGVLIFQLYDKAGNLVPDALPQLCVAKNKRLEIAELGTWMQVQFCPT